MTGTIANDLINKMFTTLSSLLPIGGQHKADDAKIDQAYAEMFSKIMDAEHTTFKDAYSQMMQSTATLLNNLQSLSSTRYEIASKIGSNV